jgi:septin family protein
MKNLATILCVGIIGFTQAQSTSKDVEIYERYENGELVEQRQSATENGVQIKEFDFEKAKREMQLKSAKMEEKADQMMRKAKQSMDVKMKEMEQKMSDFEKRSEDMHKRMDQKMKEMDSKSKENKKPDLKKVPAPSEKPVEGESTKDVKFT